MKKSNLKGSLLLLLASVIWGAAFVAQSKATDTLGTFSFNCFRYLLGSAALLPVIAVSGGFGKRAATAPGSKKSVLIGGVLCGVVLTLAGGLQQAGIAFTTVGKAGFITSLYIFLVPLIGLLFKKRSPARIWFCAVVAGVGFYLMCMLPGKLTLSLGDGLILLCAAANAIHILVIDRFIGDIRHPLSRVDCIKMSSIQFFTAGILSGVIMLFAERPTLDGAITALVPILYTGVMSSAVAYTLQMIGQRQTEPALASMVMSLESVFSLFAGVLILSQVPTLREAIGSAIVFAAVVFSQIPFNSRKKTMLEDN